MKRTIYSLLVSTILFGGWASGHCVEKKAKAWRGLELGMTRNSFLAKFPGTQPINMFTGDELTRFPEFADLSMLAYRISNDKVDQLQVMFSGDEKADIKDLTARIASDFGLSEHAFSVTEYTAVAKCATFTLKVNAGERMFTLTDNEGEAYWKKMREANRPKG